MASDAPQECHESDDNWDSFQSKAQAWQMCRIERIWNLRTNFLWASRKIWFDSDVPVGRYSLLCSLVQHLVSSQSGRCQTSPIGTTARGVAWWGHRWRHCAVWRPWHRRWSSSSPTWTTEACNTWYLSSNSKEPPTLKIGGTRTKPGFPSLFLNFSSCHTLHCHTYC
jgi:hypothetical protein